MTSKDLVRKINSRLSAKHLYKLLGELEAEQTEFSRTGFRYTFKLSRNEIVNCLRGCKVSIREDKLVSSFLLPCYTKRGVEYFHEPSFRVRPTGEVLHSYTSSKTLEEAIDRAIKHRVLSRDIFMHDNTAIAIL